jgi:hypothetical protein
LERIVKSSIAHMSAADFYDAFAKHLHWSRANNRISGTPQWDASGLNIIAVRMNALECFYIKGREDWNDHLFLIQGDTVHHIACTVDPAKVRVNPRGIAHLNEGCWDAYVRGYHKSRKRRALVQRTNPVRVTRTDNIGNVQMHEWGFFGINIHNAAGLKRPSAGCTVLKPERGFMLRDANYRRFAQILNAAPDRPSRTYCLMNAQQCTAYGYDLRTTS